MINKKQKILNRLSGKFEVISIEQNFDDDISIICEFMKNGKTGVFEYVFEGRERGVYEINGYKEEDDEDINDEIHEWVDKNIECYTRIEYHGEELNGEKMELIK